MIEIYNFFIYFSVALAITVLLTLVFGGINVDTINFDYEKQSAYECGFDPFEHTRFKLDVRFYLVAIFYIIFDLEVIFFFPLSLTLNQVYGMDLFYTFTFILFLFLGVIYEFWFGKLDWSKSVNKLILICKNFKYLISYFQMLLELPFFTSVMT